MMNMINIIIINGVGRAQAVHSGGSTRMTTKGIDKYNKCDKYNKYDKYDKYNKYNKYYK